MKCKMLGWILRSVFINKVRWLCSVKTAEWVHCKTSNTVDDISSVQLTQARCSLVSVMLCGNFSSMLQEVNSALETEKHTIQPLNFTGTLSVGYTEIMCSEKKPDKLTRKLFRKCIWEVELVQFPFTETLLTVSQLFQHLFWCKFSPCPSAPLFLFFSLFLSYFHKTDYLSCNNSKETANNVITETLRNTASHS